MLLISQRRITTIVFPCSFSFIILIDNDEPLRNDSDLQCRFTFVMSTVNLSLGSMYSVV